MAKVKTSELTDAALEWYTEEPSYVQTRHDSRSTGVADMNIKPIPNFAKAAAVLTFTSGVEGPDQALQIYEKLVTTDEPAWSVLDKHGATRWSPVDNLDPADWLEEIEMLAKSIAAAQAHFQGN